MRSDLAPVVLMGRTVVWHNCVQMSPDQFNSTGPLLTCQTLLAVWMLSFSFKKLMENIILKPRRLCQFNKTWRFLSFSFLLLLLSRLVWSSGLWSSIICSWRFLCLGSSVWCLFTLLKTSVLLNLSSSSVFSDVSSICTNFLYATLEDRPKAAITKLC